MNRRTFSLAGTALTAFAGSSVCQSAQEEQRGFRVRFAFTKIIEAEDKGIRTRFVQELGVVLKPSEQFTINVSGGCRLTLTPEIREDLILVTAVVVDQDRYPSVQMLGESLVEPGFGAGIKFQSPGAELYSLGLLVTTTGIPKSAA